MGKYFILLVVILTFLFPSGFAFAQQGEQPEDTSKNVILLKDVRVGLIFHSRGFGVDFIRSKRISEFKMRTLEFNITEVKSLKQIRTINPYFTNSKSYVYGKLNTIFAVRGMLGVQKLLNSKPYWGGVELNYFYAGGMSLAITKPIYLYILYETSDNFVYEIAEEKFDPEKHFSDNIFGRAPFTSGFNELAFYPGITVKSGLSFEFGIYRQKVKSLDVGICVDIFPNPVPIMAFNDPEYYFLTFFLNFNFGKRYN